MITLIVALIIPCVWLAVISFDSTHGIKTNPTTYLIGTIVSVMCILLLFVVAFTK